MPFTPITKEEQIVINTAPELQQETLSNITIGAPILDSGESPYNTVELQKANFATTMDEASTVINRIEDNSDLTSFMSEYFGITGMADDFLTKKAEESPWMRNFVTSDVRDYDAASRAWIMAHLRDISGAAVPAEEVYNGIVTFFPVVGDEEAQIKIKRGLRRVVQVTMRNAGGNAYIMNAATIAKDKGIVDPDRQDLIKQKARGTPEFKKKAIEKGLLPKDFK